jgi:hypothetical protein
MLRPSPSKPPNVEQSHQSGRSRIGSDSRHGRWRNRQSRQLSER